MSVLKNKRMVSNVQFIKTAYNIEVEVVNFLTHLSSKHVRLLGQPTVDSSVNLLDRVIVANNVFPSDETSRTHRKILLQEALGYLNALDVKLTLCYEVMMKNPSGCMEDKSGEKVPAEKAIDKLDKMAFKIGDLINEEEALIKGILNSDQKRQLK